MMAENPFLSPEVTRHALELLRLAHLNIKSIGYFEQKRHELTFIPEAFGDVAERNVKAEREAKRIERRLACIRRVNDKITDAFLTLAGEDWSDVDDTQERDI